MRDDLNNATYTITGPQPVSYGDVAEALSKATNRDIAYVKVPSEAHNQGMKQAGLPDWLANDLTIMSRDWDQVRDHQPTSDFKKISGTKQHDLTSFANDHASYF
jgi:uncharacterized protein YbjT (DUF2867 family)